MAPGAGAGLGAAQVLRSREAIAAARVVMASFEVPLAATLAAFDLARAAGVTTLLNPAPARALPTELAALCDVLTPNEIELRALAGLGADVPLHEAAQALLARGPRAVLVTLGAAGCRLWTRTGVASALPGWPIERVVDTVGAGDTFTGALAAALARGLALEAAMAHANAAAALSVTGRGAIGGMPDLAQVDALLACRDAAR